MWNTANSIFMILSREERRTIKRVKCHVNHQGIWVKRDFTHHFCKFPLSLWYQNLKQLNIVGLQQMFAEWKSAPTSNCSLPSLLKTPQYLSINNIIKIQVPKSNNEGLKHTELLLPTIPTSSPTRTDHRLLSSKHTNCPMAPKCTSTRPHLVLVFLSQMPSSYPLG